jgi:hypothetical protein
MKNLALVLLCCCGLVSSAGLAPAPTIHPTTCEFQSGESLTGKISISLTDHEVPADSAVVNFDVRIPPGGRTATNGVYEVPPLSIIPVTLAKNSLKHFTVRPHIVIENYASPNCKLRFDSLIGDRNWANQEKTSFTIHTTVVANGKTYNLAPVTTNVSCLDEDVSVRLASGALIPIKDVVVGDLVYDPVTGRNLKVAAVIWGTEANEKMYRIGFDGRAGLFTSQHPILTKRGLVAAVDLLGDDRSYHKVTIREPQEGDATRAVYNLRFESAAKSLRQHLLSAGGIVTGDFDAQNRLAAAKAGARRAVAVALR